MRPVIAAFLFLAALPAAAEEPDATYAKYHRAAVSGDLKEVLEHASAQQRREITGLSPAQREATVKMIASTMPRAFRLLNKTVAPGGGSAVLLLSGPGGSVLDDKAETLYGDVRLVREGGDWKVATTSWSNEPPANMRSAAIPRNVPAPAAATAPQKTADGKPAVKKPAAPAPARGAPMVGSPNAAPAHKLGMQKEPCVYKPVMTAEDMERCR